jgi:hypothetical protein
LDYGEFMEFYLYLEEKEMTIKGEYVDKAESKRELQGNSEDDIPVFRWRVDQHLNKNI